MFSNAYMLQNKTFNIGDNVTIPFHVLGKAVLHTMSPQGKAILAIPNEFLGAFTG